MVELHVIFVVLYAGIAVITAVALLLVWTRRAARGAVPLAAFMIGVVIWSAADAVMWSVPTSAQQIFWERMASLGSWVVPVAFLVLAFDVAGMERWRAPRRVAAIAIASFALNNLEWLNPAHLYDAAFIAHRVGSYTHYALMPGPLYWIFVAFAYTLAVCALVILFREYLRSSGASRNRIAVLFIGGLAPFIASVAGAFNLAPFADLDLAPLAFFVTGALWLTAILQGTLLEILPLARDVLVEQMPDGVIVIDVEGRVVDANPAALTMLGMARAKVVDWPADVVLAGIEGAEGLLHGMGSRRAVLPAGRAGDARLLELGVAPLAVGIGGSSAQLVTLRDVTRQQRAQEESARLAAIVTSSQDAVFTNDLASSVTSWNAAAEALFGYSSQEIMGADLSILLGPGLARGSSRMFERLRRGESILGRESFFRRKDGRLVELSVTLSPILDERGETVAVSFIGHDITQRRRTEREKRASEEIFTAAFKASPDLISITRMSDGVIMEVNPGYEQLLGYSRQESVGKSTVELSIWADPADRDAFVAALWESGEVHGFETTLRRKDGSVVSVLDSARTFDLRGETCLLSVAQDMTELTERRAMLVASEASLRESKESLEKMVYAVAEAMGKVVEVRDPYTEGHEVRVARLAKQIAQEMHLPASDVEAIEMAGLVHDVGKLSVPAEILTKPGRLSEIEYLLIKEHPQAGYKILKDIEFPWPLAEMVLAHHERRDGSGYPRGLRGDEIIGGGARARGRGCRRGDGVSPAVPACPGPRRRRRRTEGERGQIRSSCGARLHRSLRVRSHRAGGLVGHCAEAPGLARVRPLVRCRKGFRTLLARCIYAVAVRLPTERERS